MPKPTVFGTSRLRSVLVLLMPPFARGCGGFFCSPNQPVVQSGESIVFFVDEREISMHVQINYEGPSEEFGWILPVMYDPVLSVNSSEVMFQQLFSETLPSFSYDVKINASDAACLVDVCPPQPFPVSAPIAAPSVGGLVEETGSVGPFDFVILKPSNVSELTDWLQENNYDEYTRSQEILEQYLDQYFIALRLSKESDNGDIVPIVISYEIPEEANIDALTCIPLVLTSLSTVSRLPIQVYFLADGRADPLNFFQVELDDGDVNWLGCGQRPRISFGPFDPDSCFDRDYRARAAEAFETVDDHAFVVEYAGTSQVMRGRIALSIDVAALGSAESPNSFLKMLTAQNIPTFRFLDSIFADFIPNVYEDSSPFGCRVRESIYTPSNIQQMSLCSPFLTTKTFDAAALATEIEQKVVIPSIDAEYFVQSRPYLTRMYVSMRQEVMNEDPIFTIRSAANSVNVSNEHSALAVPSCENNEINKVSLRFRDGASIDIPATYECGRFVRSSPPVQRSPARKFVVAAFGEDVLEVTLDRDEDGKFDQAAIDASVTAMEARVALLMLQPNVTVPNNITSNETLSPTPAPDILIPPKKTVPRDANKGSDRKDLRYSAKIFDDQEERGHLTRRKLRGV